MQKIIIIGNSDYARLIREYVDEVEDFHVECFSVDGAFISESRIDGLPVVSFEEINKIYSPDSVKLILAIGYQKLGKTRRDIYTRYNDLGYEFINYIHPSAIVDKDLTIGNGNIILEGAIIQKRVQIGDGNLIWQGAIISHDDIIGNFNTFCANSVISGCVKVGDCSFFGASSTVRDKIEIASYNLIGSSAYVSKSTSENQAILPASSRSVKNAGEMLALSL